MGGSKSKPIDKTKIKLPNEIELSFEQQINTLKVTNEDNQKIKYVLDNYENSDYSVIYTPNKGFLNPKSTKDIKVEIKFKNKVNNLMKITLHLGDNCETFFNLKILGEDGVFGVDPKELEWIDCDSFKLPKPLATLNDHFKRLDGFHSEGVFRLAGQQGLMKQMKANMNKNKGTLDLDEEFTVNEIANLIKLWFRELPVLLLNSLNSAQIQKAEIEECWNEFNSLNEQSKNLLNWLFSLLIHVSQYKDQNKMTLQNLAIVVAPNLYESTSPDPMEGLMMSQKAVQFVQNVLTYMADHK